VQKLVGVEHGDVTGCLLGPADASPQVVKELLEGVGLSVDLRFEQRMRAWCGFRDVADPPVPPGVQRVDWGGVVADVSDLALDGLGPREVGVADADCAVVRRRQIACLLNSGSSVARACAASTWGFRRSRLTAVKVDGPGGRAAGMGADRSL
jgi:hypothetical protein